MVSIASLDALVSAGTLSRYEQSDDELALHVSPLQPGAALSAVVRVIPTLGGSLQSGASTVRLDGQAIHVPPEQWVVK